MSMCIENHEIKSVFSQQELDILFMDGAYCHDKGVRRASNTHSLPEARNMWDRGWIDDQIRMKKATSRNYYLRKKHERATEENDIK